MQIARIGAAAVLVVMLAGCSRSHAPVDGSEPVDGADTRDGDSLAAERCPGSSLPGTLVHDAAEFALLIEGGWRLRCSTTSDLGMPFDWGISFDERGTWYLFEIGNDAGAPREGARGTWSVDEPTRGRFHLELRDERGRIVVSTFATMTGTASTLTLEDPSVHWSRS